MNRTPCTRHVIAGAVGLAVIAALPLAVTARGRRHVRRVANRAARKARYLTGCARGIRYRLVHGGPPEDVSDDVLAQRISSKLGPLEKRLDIPHLDVGSVDRQVSLHGVVATAEQAAQIERTVLSMPGVKLLTSNLRIGFEPGETRPSEGRAATRSDMRRELHRVAKEVGLEADDAALAVGTVIRVFLHLLPEGERNHVLAHLPADVRALMDQVAPVEAGRITDEAALRDAVTFSGVVAESAADGLIRGVVDVLRRRVPEEVSDIDAVLPTDLKPLWADPLQRSGDALQNPG